MAGATSGRNERRYAMHDAFLSALQGSVARCIAMKDAEMLFNPRPVGGRAETVPLHVHVDNSKNDSRYCHQILYASFF